MPPVGWVLASSGHYPGGGPAHEGQDRGREYRHRAGPIGLALSWDAPVGQGAENVDKAEEQETGPDEQGQRCGGLEENPWVVGQGQGDDAQLGHQQPATEAGYPKEDLGQLSRRHGITYRVMRMALKCFSSTMRNNRGWL